MEDLRQICLYSLNNNTWWDYAIEFGKKCLTSTNLTICSKEIYSRLGFNEELLSKCIKGSFGNSDNIQNDNNLLSLERASFLGEGIQIWPSIRVNNITYRVNSSPIK